MAKVPINFDATNLVKLLSSRNKDYDKIYCVMIRIGAIKWPAELLLHLLTQSIKSFILFKQNLPRPRGWGLMSWMNDPAENSHGNQLRTGNTYTRQRTGSTLIQAMCSTNSRELNWAKWTTVGTIWSTANLLPSGDIIVINLVVLNPAFFGIHSAPSVANSSNMFLNLRFPTSD